MLPKTAWGQTRPFGDVGSMSGLPESGPKRCVTACRTSANSGREQPQQSGPLFDHLVGESTRVLAPPIAHGTDDRAEIATLCG
jgi:hypothetical protein